MESLAMRIIFIFLFLNLCSFSLFANEDILSFNEVKKRVFKHPTSVLESYPGISLKGLALGVLVNMGEIVTRSEKTMWDFKDFKSPAPKLLHPRGVCASGIWIINENGPYTGLFRKGTKVPAMIRFSSGTAQSQYSPKKARMLGMAIKLFPTKKNHKKVITKNILTMDKYGFSGSTRKSFVMPEDGSALYFTNVYPPKSWVGKMVGRFFDRFDRPNFARPVYAVAENEQDQFLAVKNPISPYEIRFYPRKPKKVYFANDFRTELLFYAPKSLVFDIKVMGGKNGLKVESSIGRLVVEKMVMSKVCDLELHFQHHPNERHEL
jgi:hypothetical protein